MAALLCSTFFSTNFGAVLSVDILTQENGADYLARALLPLLRHAGSARTAIPGPQRSRGMARVAMSSSTVAAAILAGCDHENRLMCRFLLGAAPLLINRNAFIRCGQLYIATHEPS